MKLVSPKASNPIKNVLAVGLILSLSGFTTACNNGTPRAQANKGTTAAPEQEKTAADAAKAEQDKKAAEEAAKAAAEKKAAEDKAKAEADKKAADQKAEADAITKRLADDQQKAQQRALQTKQEQEKSDQAAKDAAAKKAADEVEAAKKKAAADAASKKAEEEKAEAEKKAKAEAEKKAAEAKAEQEKKDAEVKDNAEKAKKAIVNLSFIGKIQVGSSAKEISEKDQPTIEKLKSAKLKALDTNLKCQASVRDAEVNGKDQKIQLKVFELAKELAKPVKDANGKEMKSELLFSAPIIEQLWSAAKIDLQNLAPMNGLELKQIATDLIPDESKKALAGVRICHLGVEAKNKTEGNISVTCSDAVIKAKVLDDKFGPQAEAKLGGDKAKMQQYFRTEVTGFFENYMKGNMSDFEVVDVSQMTLAVKDGKAVAAKTISKLLIKNDVTQPLSKHLADSNNITMLEATCK